MTQDTPEKISAGLIFYNCQEDVESYEEIYEKELKTVNFGEVIKAEFQDFFQVTNGCHLQIKTPDCIIYFGTETGPTTSREIDVFGAERGLLELIALAKANGWMVLDKSLNDLLDLNFQQQYSYPEYRELKSK